MKRILLLVLAVLALTARSGAAQATANPAQEIIKSGDVLRILIYREEELSGLRQVPRDGILAFGMIGPLTVTGMTAEELRLKLVELYAKYLVNYTVQVELLRKVTVAGAVKNPAVYTLDGTNTVSDALAIAGGVLPEGRLDRIELRRDGALVQVLLADRTISESPIRSGDQIYVPEKSYVSRNGSTMIAALTGVLGIIVTLLVK